MPMYTFIEYIDNYSKTCEILWQYCKDEPAINAVNGNDVDFNAANAATNWFKIKKKKINRWNIQWWHKKCWNNGTINI